MDALVARLLAKDPSQRLGHVDDVAAALVELGATDEELGGPRPKPYLYRPAFLGRGAEMKRFEQQLGDRGRGGVSVLQGTAWVGRTRLLAEMATRAREQGVEVLLGECLHHPDGAAPPLHPFRRMLQGIADRCREEGEVATRKLLGTHGSVLARYEASLQGLAGVESDFASPSPSAEGGRHLVYEALASLIGAASPRGTVILFLDDIQDADELTAGFLSHLTYHESAILAVVARRSGAGSDTGEVDADGAHAGLEPLTIAPLSDADVQGGRPRHAGGSGGPGAAGGVREAAGPGDPVRRVPSASMPLWPPAILSAIACRAGSSPRIPPGPACLSRSWSGSGSLVSTLRRDGWATVAAVLGRTFLGGDLREVAGIDDDELLDQLDRFTSLRITEETRPGRFRFVHAELHQWAYEGCDPTQRRELHRRAAALMDPAPERAAEAASHWERAGARREAAAAYLRAARRFMEQFAHAQSERCLLAYLALADDGDPDRVQARNDLGEHIYLVQGRYREALEQLQAAEAEARTMGRADLEAASLRLAAHVHWDEGRMDDARKGTEKAARTARDAGDLTLAGRCLLDLAGVYQGQGELEPARRHYDESARAAAPVGVSHGRRGGPRELRQPSIPGGEAGRAEDLYRAAVEIHEECGNLRGQANVLTNHAVVCQQAGRREESLQLYERALQIVRRVGERPSKDTSCSTSARSTSPWGGSKRPTRCWSRPSRSRDRPGIAGEPPIL